MEIYGKIDLSPLAKVQEEQSKWAKRNFPASPAWHPLLGAVEEIGELAHHYLKRSQDIRNHESHDAEIVDAIGDIIIYLCHFCTLEDINIEGALLGAWENVKKRNWVEDPDTAHLT